MCVCGVIRVQVFIGGRACCRCCLWGLNGCRWVLGVWGRGLRALVDSLRATSNFTLTLNFTFNFTLTLTSAACIEGGAAGAPWCLSPPPIRPHETSTTCIEGGAAGAPPASLSL